MFYDMIKFLPKNLIALAKSLSQPLYVVGGFCRNFLIDQTISNDIDLSSSVCIDEISEQLEQFGFKTVTEIKRTGTLIFFDGKRTYEFTNFRKEEYVGGEHTPYKTTLTKDIFEDALRRDFKCNAVYYDIKNEKFVDPLGGIEDINNRILDTATDPKKVFCHDGLRLMRLARFVGELDFTPTEEVLLGANTYAENIKEISAERIFAELKKILVSDFRYPFSSKEGHYKGLKILEKTRVLDLILPELTEGRNMAQRADFHLYDVLEHSLRTVLYAEPSIRLSALLHDVGKPYCMNRDGCYHLHFKEGERIADDILRRLKADKKTREFVKFLVREHMVDLDLKMKEKKIRRYIVKNHKRFSSLMDIKQADFRASLEKHEIAPTVLKWQGIYCKMNLDGTPFSLKDLKISAQDLLELNFKEKEIGKELEKLFELAVENPEKNNYQALIKIAEKDAKKLIN